MNEDELCLIKPFHESESTSSSEIEHKYVVMTNNISESPLPSNDSQDGGANANGTNTVEMMSLERVGAVDGAVPEVVSSEDDNSQTETQNINGTSTWSPEDLEHLRKVRSRAYTKVTNKKRQHLQASLTTYLQIEWRRDFPTSKLTGRKLLDVYVEHFENDENSHNSTAPVRVRGRGGRRGGLGMRGRRGRAGYRSGGNSRIQRQKIMAINKLTTRATDTTATTPQAKRGSSGRGRGRGRGNFGMSTKRKRGGLSLGTRHNNTIETTNSIPVIPDEDHSDRLWSNTMLSHLLHCGKVAEERQNKKNVGTGNKGQDFVEILYQEWKKIYPNSTMNSRNIKSRLSVYKKTKGDFPHPTKRRKLEIPSPVTGPAAETKETASNLQSSKPDVSCDSNSTSISLKEHFSSMLTKKSSAINPPLCENTCATQQATDHGNVETIVEQVNVDHRENDDITQAIKSQTAGLFDEVNDEFVPENANTSSQSSISGQAKSCCPSETTSTPETVKVEFVKDEGSLEMEGDSNSRSSPSLSRRVSVEQACPKHWCHVFHDTDKEVVCVLTEQLLEIRKQLEPQFPGCDIYSPRKPKGFSASVLDQWKKYYPHTEESVKTIAHKLSKFDRGPDLDLDANGVKITPKGRVMWSQIMLNNLQEAKKLATERCKIGESIGIAWKEEWLKMYPDLKVEWRTVISRYNYHFGGIDEQDNSLAKRESSTDSIRESSVDSNLKSDTSNDVEQKENYSIQNGIIPTRSNDPDKTNYNLPAEEYHDMSVDDSSSRSNVKGFRNWTIKTKQELVETKNKIVLEHPNIIQGSSEFNHLLLREFLKLNPKCMESSRSIYSKLQSIEKALNTSVDNNLVSRSTYDDAEDSRSNASSSDQRVYKECTPDEIVEHSPEIREPLIATFGNGPNKQSPSNTSINADEDGDSEQQSFENSTIEGFQDWTLGMIRDFIACMDTARRRHAELRENQPNEQVKLVPLLLEEWRSMYPNSKETVKTFLVKIKHLKLQKDVIKKHLVEGNTNDNNGHSQIFKWNRDMIQDVIDSRRRALEIKDQALAEGKKLSFHALWASQFKRVYPNSTFTSNNLSVHFWTWRKQQLKNKKLSKKATTTSDTVPGVEPVSHSSNNLELSKEAKVYNAPGPWSKLYKKQLLEVGRRVEKMLQEKDTPNEVKLEGFANILHGEWKKVQKATNGTKQDVSARAINMMYSRLLRENNPSLYLGRTSFAQQLPPINNEDTFDDLDSRITATWTPKHNRVLRECMEGKFEDTDKDGDPISHAVFTDRIIKQWRKKFPKSSISDDDLLRRISDSMFNTEAVFASSQVNREMERDILIDNKINLKIKDEKFTPSTSEKGSDCNASTFQGHTYRLPNAKGQMVWNKQSIIDLFRSYYEASQYLKDLDMGSKNNSTALSFLVHKRFVKLHPHCRLSAVMLLAKHYQQKDDMKTGVLDIMLPKFSESKMNMDSFECKREGVDRPDAGSDIQSSLHTDSSLSSCVQHPLETSDSLMSKKPKCVRDLVFRTWTQEMIDDMLKTRKIAIGKKKKRTEKNPCDPITITDLWYDEFLKCHPDYKSTKKNLWRKYKWYTSRIKNQVPGQEKAIYTHESNSSAKTGDKNKEYTTQSSFGFGCSLPTRDDKLCVPKQEIGEEPVRLKPIRKDIFHFIKAVLEESRIFLPMKLPEESFLKHYREKLEYENTTYGCGKSTGYTNPLSMVVNNGNDQIITDNTTLSAIGDSCKNLSEFPSNLNVPNLPCLGLNDPHLLSASVVKSQKMFPQSQNLMHTVPKLPSSVTVTPQLIETNSEADTVGTKHSSAGKRSSIKLPGGATLVAVTDRNADLLLKPKQMEKPHVTITIGEKGDKKERKNSSSSTTSDGGNAIAVIDEIPITNSFNTSLNSIPPVSKSCVSNPENTSSRQSMQQTSITAILQTPNQTIPLRIPFPINIPQYTPTRSVSLVAPPPLPQLKPFTSLNEQNTLQTHRIDKQIDLSQTFSRAILIPGKLKCRMEELGLNEKMFIDLLREYDASRDMYINTLKRGYLMFFPYLLGSKWREKYHTYAIPGRKLQSLIDMYIEEKRKTKVAPEYLTKVPCNFVVTESILKQIQLCHIETVKRLQKSAFDRFNKDGKHPLVEPAHIYVEMCKRWLKVHPDIRMTTKQLISIHRMLDYEHLVAAAVNSRNIIEPSPEIICHMADVWKLLDKEVPDQQIIVDVEEENKEEEESIFDEECMEMEREIRDKLVKIEPDDDDCFDASKNRHEFGENLSIEEHQEWISATQFLVPSHENKVNNSRPRYSSKNPRLFWSTDRIQDLMNCRRTAIQRFKCQKRVHPHKRSQLDILFNEFKRLHNRMTLSKYQIAGKCIRKMRLDKKLCSRNEDKIIKKWKAMCKEFIVNEENIEVTNEEHSREQKIGGQDIPSKAEKFSLDLSLDDDSCIVTNELEQASSISESGSNIGLGGFRLTNLNQNLGNLKVAAGNPNNLNFNRDQDVLAYIKETQNLTGKGNHGVTWTADVISDLVQARSEARRRKREWEIWATKKYGGIGIAYNNPNIHYQKVDEMFKEEWSKLRPDLSSLSVWTLVSYARKYDALKKQLIVDNGQVEESGEQKVPRFGYRRDVVSGITSSVVNSMPHKQGSILPSFSTVFFPESGLPKYDLKVLNKLDSVTQELKDLIKTRQLAKERQTLSINVTDPKSINCTSLNGPRDSEANLLYLWKQEWLKLKPADQSLAKGNLLLKRLWTLFRVGSNWTRVRPALMRQTTDQKRKEYSFKPKIQDDELLHIRPRRPVFPEDEWQELIHDEEMAPHSNGNSLLLWSNLSPNPLLKRSKKLISGDGKCTLLTCDGRNCDKYLCTSPKGKLLGKQTKVEDAYKAPPQKHTLICFDRELFEQMSLDLEVPILQVALDNNASIEIDDVDDPVLNIYRRSNAYQVLQYCSNIDITSDLQKPKLLESNEDSYYCTACKNRWSNVNNFQYHLQHHL